ncbi:MAG TPA: glycosyltransferase family 4 protein [Nitrospinota bacterium]|nr:glycosyltransferase family 4 protein [Nitrospinota bacterium]|tara:strand:- start:46561 stop:47757 length:1197 start_codon:yes stop_codon:yes gene_type:complete
MKVAFVIPFYGSQIGGGAETQCRRLAENLVSRGFEVEVLTTTLKDLSTNWNHPYHDPGEYIENNVVVRRFVPRKTDTDIFVPVNERIINGEELSLEEEEDYSHNAVNSDAMYQFMAEHKNDYVYFFIPYLFGTSLNGSKIAPEKSFLVPCLHDEGYAKMTVTRKMFQRVNGVLFNSRAEMRLAKTIYRGLPTTESILMAEGVDPVLGADGQRFRAKMRLNDTPFILYVGRRDPGKNTPTLIEYFRRYRKINPSSSLRLILIGPQDIEIPKDEIGYIDDLGFVSLEEKRDAIAASTLLCQPSLMESFSLVIMESWLCGRPVLVHNACEPTREHVHDSGGGLTFDNFPEFYEAVNLLVNNPELATLMGQKGEEYVKANFGWDVICDRFGNLLKSCTELVF